MEDIIHGTTMPVLEMRLDRGERILAESGELSWMSEHIELATNTGTGGMKGLFKRAVSGGTIFMTEYSAPRDSGSVSFAAHLPGTIFSVEVAENPNQTWFGHRHAFMCGTQDIQFGVGRSQNMGSGFFGRSGFFLQKIYGHGRAWVQLAGEIITLDLQPGQRVRVHPGHIGLFQESVSYNITTVPGIKNKLFGGDGLFLVELTGPGRVYLQSLTLARLAASLAEYLEPGGGGGGAIAGAAGGFAAGSILDNIFGS